MRGIQNWTSGVLAILIISLGAISCTSYKVNDQSTNKLMLNPHQETAKSVARITFRHTNFGGYSGGTGSVFYRSELGLNDTYTYRMLTAAHVMPEEATLNEYECTLTFVDVISGINKPIVETPTIEILAINKIVDYCIFSFKSQLILDPMLIPEFSPQLKIGQKVYLAGCDLLTLPSTRSGFISLTRSHTVPSTDGDISNLVLHAHDYFSIDIAGIYGASGSSIVNEGGECIGIYVSLLTYAQPVYQRQGSTLFYTSLVTHIPYTHVNNCLRISAVMRDLEKSGQLDLLLA